MHALPVYRLKPEAVFSDKKFDAALRRYGTRYHVTFQPRPSLVLMRLHQLLGEPLKSGPHRGPFITEEEYDEASHRLRDTAKLYLQCWHRNQDDRPEMTLESMRLALALTSGSARRFVLNDASISMIV